MSGIHDQDRIEALRRRLYERGSDPEEREHFELEDEPKEVPTTWQHPPEKRAMDMRRPEQPPAAPSEPVTPEPTEPVTQSEEPESVFDESESETMSPTRKKRGYRLKLILAGLVFFIAAVGISSLLMIAGNKTISGENIAVTLDGPFTIGGGETIPLQVTVSNNNNVPIQAATLIVEYPLGTKSVGEERELFIERLPLETIGEGETVNVPLRAIVFGEENEEKAISLSIEYRVEGSNATFFKEAEPLRFKISSSPIVLSVAALKKISSGQETDIELTITSNAQNAISNLLVKAEYPQGFDFTSAAPETVSGDNVWEIGELAPEGKQVITIRGVVFGKETDEKAMHFSVGIPSERDPYSLASVFTTGTTEFEIEEAFLDVALSIGSSANEAVVEPGQATGVSINFENTLDSTLYDAVVEVKLSGNALSDLDVGPPGGFYDSTNNTIIWDQTTRDSLAEIAPGAKERLTFNITPAEVARTPEIEIEVNVRARRVSERDVAEQLVGAATGNIMVQTTPDLLAEAAKTAADSGPVPPVVGQETSYTLTTLIANGSNEITDAEVSTVLPIYVKWLDDYTGSMSYNSVTRTVTWDAGTVSANGEKQASFRVAITPSTSQIETTPTLMGEQRLRATDNFTGTVVRSTNPAVTTELSSEAGYGQGSGRVQAN